MSLRPLTVALMLESDGPGGAEVLLLQLAQELRRRGHRVHPIGPEHGDGWLSARLRESGFEPKTFRLRSPLDWSCVRRLAELIRRLEVDVLHGHEFDGAVYGTAAAMLAGRPSVITMHGNESVTRALRRRVALRWGFRRSRAVVAVSDETKRQLDRDLRLRPDAVSVIRNGVPVPVGDPSRVRQELGIGAHEPMILAVGNLIRRKGHLVLLRALQRLESEGLGAPWRLVVVGGWGGDQRPLLEAFAAEHGLEGRVHILTYRNDVPDLQAAADLFVMPSLWEGLPLAILEAMLAGTPVIATDVCGIPEAIVHAQHGWLVPPGDVDALASALRTLLTDPGLRKQLADAARARALREFTIESMTTAYESLYRRVASPALRAAVGRDRRASPEASLAAGTREDAR